MNENEKYETIKKLVESGGNKQRAAIQLHCTIRHINRMIKGYEKKGRLSLSMAIAEESPLTLLMTLQSS